MNPIAHIETPFKTKFGVPRQAGLADYNALVVFVARCGRYAHHDVHGFIAFAFNVMCGSKIYQPLANLLLMLRGAGNTRNLLKDREYFFGFQVIHVLFLF